MTILAAATGLQAAAALCAALAAAAVLVLPRPGQRAWAMPAAVVLAALTLLTVADDQLADALDGRLGLAAAGLLAGAAGLVGAALAFRRWPGAFVIAAVAFLPARIPVTIGDETANLLLPLYAVIGAGMLARLLARDAPPPPHVKSLVAVERVLALVVVLYAVQALYSRDVEAAAKDVAFFYVPFAVLFRLLLDAPWSRGLVKAAFGTVAGLALLCAAVGLEQYATRDLLLDNEKVLLANELKPYFRVNSLFYDPNIYGRFLALAMTMVAAVLLWSRTRRTTWLCAAALALMWAGLVPSLSESSFAALAVGLTVLAALRWHARPVLAAAGTAAALAVAVIVIAPSAVGFELGSFEELNESTSGRAELIRGGLRMARDRPVGGYGSGSFAAEYRDRENLLSPRSPAESHTIPVTVAAEQGIIGLGAYLFLLATALALALRGVRHLAARAAVGAAFAALLLHTLVYASFLEDPITWALLAVAAVLRRDHLLEPAQAALGPRGRPAEAVPA